MFMWVCRCCGGDISPTWQRSDRHICPSCEQLLEDDVLCNLDGLFATGQDQSAPRLEEKRELAEKHGD